MISIERVEELYGSNGAVQVFGLEARIRCPSPDHNDLDPSASVNLSKATWHCFSCGASGVVEDQSYEHGEDDLDSELARTRDRINLLVQSGSNRRGKVRTREEKWLYRFQHPRRYELWSARGIPASTVDSYDLGYDELSDALTYPFRNNEGELVDVVRRFLDPTLGKYKYPSGCRIADYWYAYHLAQPCGGEIWVCEGAIDAIALREVGFDAIAQYGGKITTEQRRLLDALDPTTVVLCYDQDDAGRDNIGVFLEGPMPSYNIKIATFGGDYKDPADVPKEVRAESMKLTSVWNYTV